MPSSTSTITKGKRGRRSSAASAQNRERILAAALACFARLGYRNTSNEIIAREAELTAGALYNHFSNKGALYISVFEYAESYISRFYQPPAIPDTSTREAIETFFEQAERLYHQNPDVARFLCQVSIEVFHNTELAMPLAEKLKGGVEAGLEHIIEAGIQRGEVRPSVIPQQLVELYINSQLGIAQMSLFYGADYYSRALSNLKNHMLELMFPQS